MRVGQPSRETRDAVVMLLAGALFVFYLSLHWRVIFSPIDRLPFTILVPATATLVFLLSLRLLGPARALALLGIGTLTAFAMEWFGERSGAVFGPYCYTDLLGPKIGERIPLLIPFAWYMMLLPSYVIANLLGEGAPRSERPRTWVWTGWMAVLSAAVLTAWDLTMDPIMSFEIADELEALNGAEGSGAGTIGIPAWRWIDAPVAPGGCATAPRIPDADTTHFGVPWLNYRGWMLTGFLAFAAFRSVEHRLPGDTSPHRGVWQERLVAVVAIGIYFGMAMIDTVVGSPKVQDIHLIAPFAMGIPAAAAVMLLFRRRLRGSDSPPGAGT